MSKKQAPQALLDKYLQEQKIADLEQKIVDLEKKLATETSYKDTFYAASKKFESELDQIHQVLDALPNSIARKSDHENSWERVERSALTRLAAWLGSRKE